MKDIYRHLNEKGPLKVGSFEKYGICWGNIFQIRGQSGSGHCFLRSLWGQRNQPPRTELGESKGGPKREKFVLSIR